MHSADPAETPDLGLPLPGEASVDAALVDQVVDDLNRIYQAKGLETARAVGELLLVRFFDGDPARFHERGKDHSSFRLLADRDDLSLSHAFFSLTPSCGTPAPVPPESRPGRKPLPAVVKGLTRLKAAVALAGSEELGALDADRAREVLAELDAQVATLGEIRARVVAAVGR